MQIVDRDKYEGQPFFDACDVGGDVDVITGRLLTSEGVHYGWYAVKKIPDTDKVIDYVDPATFDSSRRLCSEYIIRCMNITDTKWRYMNVWIPNKGVDKSTNDAFENAMKVVNEFR